MDLKKALPEVVLAINKALPEVLLVIKYSYRKKIWSSNILTGRRSGSQISLPDMSMVSQGFEKLVSKRGFWPNLGGEGS